MVWGTGEGRGVGLLRHLIRLIRLATPPSIVRRLGEDSVACACMHVPKSSDRQHLSTRLLLSS